MFTKVYMLKFPSLNDAKIAVSYLSEEIGGSIAECNLAGLQIMLDKVGTVTMTVLFDTLAELQAFEKAKSETIKVLQNSFALKLSDMSMVAVFAYSREAEVTM